MTTQSDDNTTARTNLILMRQGIINRTEFDERLVKRNLTPADIGESEETIVAAARVGSIASARRDLNLMRQGTINRTEFDKRLVKRNLTPADIGESEETIAVPR